MSPLPRRSAMSRHHFTRLAEESIRRVRNNVVFACNECKVKQTRFGGNYTCWWYTDKALHCNFRPGEDRPREGANSEKFLVLSS
jgi:hypothetical protein